MSLLDEVLTTVAIVIALAFVTWVVCEAFDYITKGK